MYSLFVLASALVPMCLADPHCQEDDNARQWGCAVINVTMTVPEAASMLHINPNKFAAFNNFKMADRVESGWTVRVPLGDSCQPNPGVWGCYTVVDDGDTLEEVAKGTKSGSLCRNVTLLLEFNKPTLFGEIRLYPGMQLKMPRAICPPGSLTHECYTAQSGDTLISIASLFNSSTEVVLQMNENVLAGVTTILPGMELLVPRRRITLYPPTPFRCDEQEALWQCYTVKSGDTIEKIAFTFGVNPVKLATQWNNLPNISQIEINQVLVLPSTARLSCTDKPGAWTCEKSYATQPGAFVSVMNLYGGFAPDTAAWNQAIGLAANGSVPGGAEPYPTNAVFPNQQIKVPVVNCLPTMNYSCVPISEIFPPPSPLPTPQPSPRLPTCTDDRDPYAGCEARGGVNKTLCEAIAMNHVSWGNNSNCEWNAVRGLCTSKCKAYETKTACLNHHSADYTSPSCSWTNSTHTGVGYVHGRDFFSIIDIYHGSSADPAILLAQTYGYLKCRGKPCQIWPQQSTHLETQSYFGECFGQGVSSYCPQDGSVCPHCTTKPGEHICYKPFVGQTMTSIGKIFGIGAESLCQYNSMGNCSCLAGQPSWIKVPSQKKWN